MARDIYQKRAPAERLTLSGATDRYLSNITPTKKESTQPLSELRRESFAPR
ncbi:hypothetical protein [Salinisphaera sp.]|uniref:hypothetical protein n=1 Tax=Salinisphaera sp. TaxID=1914330 RepID=UPI002D799889|nr:hypothetical protein [Salinisphaera sp.]HET7314054.1 hypothetical protein [Salinisphaera sp.]